MPFYFPKKASTLLSDYTAIYHKIMINATIPNSLESKVVLSHMIQVIKLIATAKEQLN